jgi:hypothetical protein
MHYSYNTSLKPYFSIKAMLLLFAINQGETDGSPKKKDFENP